MTKKSGLADSPFFLQPSQEQVVKPTSLAPLETERTEFRTEKRSESRTTSIPSKRRTTRYSFEFYEDQILALKQLKYETEMAGHKVNLSDFAREAFDLYLKDKKTKK